MTRFALALVLVLSTGCAPFALRVHAVGLDPKVIEHRRRPAIW